MSGAISEGVEETTEEIAADVALQMGKGFDSIKSTLTGEEYNNNYDYFKSNPLERYFTAAVGGAIGGAVFKASDRFQAETSGYKDFKEMLGDNDKLLHQYITMVSQGHTNDIVSDITKLRESVIGSANIDANTGEATTDTKTSQKAAIFDTMINGIKDLDTFLTNNNLKVGFEDIENVELLKGLRVAWLKDNMGNNKALKSLTQEYIHRVKEMADLHAEKESVLSRAISEQAKKDEYDVERGRIEAVIETKRNELNDLLQGKDDSYIGRLFLETNPQILNLLSPRSKEDISKNLYGIEYDKLPKYLKAKVDSISDSKNENAKSE